nr:GNAT family N-acetyltransferase [Pedobacter sp. ASV19]
MTPITNNTREQQFEIESNGLKATLTYRFYKHDIALMHTFVPEQLSGMGIASMLAKEAFAYAKEIKRPVMVYCPFVAGFIKKHPEYQTQLDPEYHPAKR